MHCPSWYCAARKRIRNTQSRSSKTHLGQSTSKPILRSANCCKFLACIIDHDRMRARYFGLWPRAGPATGSWYQTSSPIFMTRPCLQKRLPCMASFRPCTQTMALHCLQRGYARPKRGCFVMPHAGAHSQHSLPPQHRLRWHGGVCQAQHAQILLRVPNVAKPRQTGYGA